MFYPGTSSFMRIHENFQLCMMWRRGDEDHGKEPKLGLGRHG